MPLIVLYQDILPYPSGPSLWGTFFKAPCFDLVNRGCTYVVYKTQSWKAGPGIGVGQLGPAGSQLLLWLAA